MQSRAHVLALVVMILVGVAPHAWSEDTPRGQQGAATKPPSIEYGRSRASSGWVETPAGTRVAIDRGVEWQGTTIYLSLLWDLIGVDKDSG
jgi:hypothetical protein